MLQKGKRCLKHSHESTKTNNHTIHPLSALKLSNALENPMKVLLKGMIPSSIEFQMHKNS
jgi:hypothetical protein